MKLTDIQHLEQLAAKGAAINTSAKTLLELREVLFWARRAYALLTDTSQITFGQWSEVMESAPVEVKE